MISNAEDKYDTLVVDIGIIMEELRRELFILESLMDETEGSLSSAYRYTHYRLQEVYKKLHEVL